MIHKHSNQESQIQQSKSIHQTNKAPIHFNKIGRFATKKSTPTIHSIIKLNLLKFNIDANIQPRILIN